MTSPASHRVPPEMIAGIVRQLAVACDWSTLPSEDLGLWAYRRWLRVCCLVCRYWAQVCRPVMLRKVTLRSERALKELLHLLSSPVPVNPSLADCILSVDASHEGVWGRPWIHRLSYLGQRLTHKPDVCLIIWSPTGRSVPGLWTSVLPRTLPGYTLPVQTLRLNRVRFQNVGGFFRAIANLPNMRHLDCNSLSFVDGTVGQGLLANHPRHRLVESQDDLYIRMSECGSPQMEKELVFHVLSNMCRRRHNFFVDQGILHAFRRLVMILDVSRLVAPSLRIDSKSSIASLPTTLIYSLTTPPSTTPHPRIRRLQHRHLDARTTYKFQPRLRRFRAPNNQLDVLGLDDVRAHPPRTIRRHQAPPLSKITRHIQKDPQRDPRRETTTPLARRGSSRSVVQGKVRGLYQHEGRPRSDGRSGWRSSSRLVVARSAV